MTEPAQGYLGNWTHPECFGSKVHKTLLDAVRCQRDQIQREMGQVARKLDEADSIINQVTEYTFTLERRGDDISLHHAERLRTLLEYEVVPSTPEDLGLT